MAELRDDLELEHPSHVGEPARSPASPGKRSLTSGLAPSAGTVAREVIRLMRKEERDRNGVVPGADGLVGAASSSSGQPLPDPVRTQFESSLGADLSSVRVHTGGESQIAANAVGARAYTVGQDIHFGAGQYAPQDPFGLHLLAHEVAHTVQQAGGAARKAQFKLEVSQPGDAHEDEADRAADAMVAGAPFAVTAGGGVIQRDPLDLSNYELANQPGSPGPHLVGPGGSQLPEFMPGDPMNSFQSTLAPSIGPFKPNIDAFGVPYEVPTSDYRAAVSPTPPDLHADMPEAQVPDPGPIPGWKTTIPPYKSTLGGLTIEAPAQDTVVRGDFHSSMIKQAWDEYRGDGIGAVVRAWNADARAKMSSYTMHAKGNPELDAMIEELRTDFRMANLGQGKGTLSEQTAATNISGGSKASELGSQIATTTSDPKSTFNHDLAATAHAGTDGTVGGPVGKAIDELKAARIKVGGATDVAAGVAKNLEGAQSIVTAARANVQVVKLKKDVEKKKEEKDDIESGQRTLKRIDPSLARIVKEVQSHSAAIKTIKSLVGDVAGVIKGDYTKILHIGETLLDAKKAAEISKIEEEIKSLTAQVEQQYEVSAAAGLTGALAQLSGLAQQAAGETKNLKAALLNEKLTYDGVADAIEKNWKGKNKKDGQLAARAMRAMPVVRKVVAVLEDIGAKMPPLPSMGTRASQGYTLAMQGVGAPGAADLHKVAGWIAGSPAAIEPEVRLWNAVLAQLETMMPALMSSP